jgi:ATP-binding cassette subfamily B protein
MSAPSASSATATPVVESIVIDPGAPPQDPAAPAAAAPAAPAAAASAAASASSILPPMMEADAKRIQAAVAPAEDESKSRALLRSFWLLQPGRWWEWAAIWSLQNFRFAPIYILPLLTGYLIDSIDPANPAKTFDFMPTMMLAAIGLCVANVVGDTTARFMLSRISRTLTANLRAALIHRLNRLELTFHDKERMGEIESKFTLDLNRLEGFQGFIADGILMNLTVIIVMTGIILVTNPVLPVIIFVALVINLVMVRLLWRQLSEAQEAYRRSEGSFMHRLSETLMGLRIARAHATEEFAEERLRKEAAKVARTGMSLDFRINLFGSSSWAISTLLNTAVVLFGVSLVVIEPRTYTWLGMSLDLKPITLGEMTVLLSYYGIITGAITATINQLPTVTGAYDAIRSLGSLYRDEDEARPLGGPQLASVAGAIELRDVCFTYAGKENPSIDRLSLTIPAGSSVAFVGPSGGGKSTLASLILGFYHPQQGTISIDGHLLGAIDLRSLRRHVGVVSQDVTLFNDTILRNIAWGDRRPDLARAQHAADLANASEFIAKFPAGMHHVLGDRGTGLSGGQRQRLAIARALYRDPRILILDEATSALDPESERLVQIALQQAMRDRTTIVIAHRLSTIREVDRIVVIADGCMCEVGTYDELVQRGGAFARMVAGDLRAS